MEPAMKRRERKALDQKVPELLFWARQAVPQEACGLIEWNGRHMTVRPCENVSTRPEDSFLLDPATHKRHLEEIMAAGTEFWGVYHSHPGEGADPSETDVAFAAYLPVWWVIVGLRPRARGLEYDLYVGRPASND